MENERDLKKYIKWMTEEGCVIVLTKRSEELFIKETASPR